MWCGCSSQPILIGRKEHRKISVLVKDRKINNDFNTIVHANEMRYKMTHLLFRDFGTHNKKDIVRKKYKVHINEDTPEEDYKWILDDERDVIAKMLANLCANLTSANSIFPENREELNLRRMYQDKAIGNCFQIKSELQYIITIFNVNVDKYIPYSDDLDYQVYLIKQWRKSNRKFMPTILKNEENLKRKELELDQKLRQELEQKIREEIQLGKTNNNVENIGKE